MLIFLKCIYINLIFDDIVKKIHNIVIILKLISTTINLKN